VRVRPVEGEDRVPDPMLPDLDAGVRRMICSPGDILPVLTLTQNMALGFGTGVPEDCLWL
jgi:hypothetical protein